MNFLKLFFLINIFNFVTSFSDYGLICNNPKLLEHYSRKYVINKDKLMNEKLSILDKNFQLPDCKFKEFVPDLKSDDNKIIDKGTDDYFKEKNVFYLVYLVHSYLLVLTTIYQDMKNYMTNLKN